MNAALGIPSSDYGRFQAVRDHCVDDIDTLDVIDYILQHCHADSVEGPILSDLLDAGRSQWKLLFIEEEFEDEYGAPHSGDHFMLVARVSKELESIYLGARSASEVAGGSLTLAWALAYGRDEDPKGAWRAAIAAVENVLQPIILPKNSSASLGHIKREIEKCPDKFDSLLPTWPSDKISSIDAFKRVFNILTYEPGRHGTDPTIPAIETARSVVAVAAVIVLWVQEGMIRRK